MLMTRLQIFHQRQAEKTKPVWLGASRKARSIIRIREELDDDDENKKKKRKKDGLERRPPTTTAVGNGRPRRRRRRRYNNNDDDDDDVDDQPWWDVLDDDNVATAVVVERLRGRGVAGAVGAFFVGATGAGAADTLNELERVNTRHSRSISRKVKSSRKIGHVRNDKYPRGQLPPFQYAALPHGQEMEGLSLARPGR